MKIRLFIALLLLIYVSEYAKAQNKHALIIAIGNYPKDGGWSTISSIKDVGYVKTALQNQEFKDIRTLTDAEATAKGIKDALAALVRDESIKKGDVVLIHISSHGEQVADNNDDESDGYDETIVGYDAKLPSRGADLSAEDYEKFQAAYFRDDDFGSYINQLRGKLGKNGDIVVFIDACHSGSGTRGFAKVRGGQPPLQPKGYMASKKAGSSSDDVFREGKGSRGNEADLATYVVFSAARAEELNYETIDDETQSGIGSLTYAISKTFANLDKNISYRSLFSKIEMIMNQKVPGQHPVLEGNGLDRGLFGGRYVEQKKYFIIERIRDPREFVITGGIFAGLDSGAKVKFYPPGTVDPAKVKALDSGTVVKAGSFASTVKLRKDSKIESPKEAWVFADSLSFREDPVVVSMRPSARGPKALAFNDAEASAINSALKSIPLISTSGNVPELFLVKGQTADSIIIASNGYLFETVNNLASNADKLKNAIERYIQYRLLRNFVVTDADATVDIKLIPVINGVPDSAKIANYMVGNSYSFKVGDQFVIWAKNNTFQPLYVNILDLQPDGKINPILPNKTPGGTGKPIEPRDLMLPPGGSRLFKNFVITLYPPLGTEVFKAFVSTDAIDMETIAMANGGNARANFGALERLVKKSYEGTRGGGMSNMGTADGTTFNIVFEIKKK